ncbi:MAG: DUF4159 domain-containing protein [Candidatus Wallbacteria bacterium]|nr:DUF4159 domain-containing protein [Candidatus Wallbacteria bacterium]
MRATLNLQVLAVVCWALCGVVRADPAVDGKWTIARLHYSGGGDWYGNPSSLPNLLRELSARTTVRAANREAVVTLKTNDVFNYPLIYCTGHGNISFSPEEAERLRKYLTSGGFWWADDNYGMDESLRPQLKKLFPDKKLVELPPDHEIYNSFYKLPQGLPKIHEHHGGPGHGYALFHEGRMIFYYTYNTDIGDGLEDPDVHRDPPAKRESAMKMAVNVVLYVLTH